MLSNETLIPAKTNFSVKFMFKIIFQETFPVKPISGKKVGNKAKQEEKREKKMKKKKEWGKT